VSAPVRIQESVGPRASAQLLYLVGELAVSEPEAAARILARIEADRYATPARELDRRIVEVALRNRLDAEPESSWGPFGRKPAGQAGTQGDRAPDTSCGGAALPLAAPANLREPWSWLRDRLAADGGGWIEIHRYVGRDLTIQVDGVSYPLPRREPYTDYAGRQVLVRYRPDDLSWIKVTGLVGDEGLVIVERSA